MNQQDKQEPNDQQPLIEDLTVNEDQAEEIKGGPKIVLTTTTCGG